MIPDRTKAEQLRGNLDLVNDTVRVALLKASTEYSPDSSAHEFVNDVLDNGTTGDEFDDTNYSRKTLGSKTVNEDNTDAEGEWDGGNITWTNLGGSQTVEAVLIYKQVGGDDTTPGDDPILRIIDDSETSELEKQTNGDDFTIQWNSEGIINLN